MSDFAQQPAAPPAPGFANLTDQRGGPMPQGDVMPAGVLSPFWEIMGAGPGATTQPQERHDALVPPTVAGNAGALGREAGDAKPRQPASLRRRHVRAFVA